MCDVKKVKRNDGPTKWEEYAVVLSLCSNRRTAKTKVIDYKVASVQTVDPFSWD